MLRTINLHNRLVSYSVRKSKRARRVRLAVFHDGSLVVTLPQRMPQFIAEKFVREKSEWIVKKLDFFKKMPFPKAIKLTHNNYLKNKDKALTLATERVEYFNKKYEYKYHRISIRNQKTRWGSCSKKKNLNFNFKILFLPKTLRDYIIVHELCHLKEMNHSKRFWNLVAKTFPEYKKIVKDLRVNDLYLQ